MGVESTRMPWEWWSGRAEIVRLSLDPGGGDGRKLCSGLLNAVFVGHFGFSEDLDTL